MNNRARSGPTRRRVAMVFLLLVAVVPLWVPVKQQLLVAYDLHQARRALDNVELQQAEERLQAVERRQPDRSDVHYLLAVSYRRHAEYDLAEKHLLRARALGWPIRDLERQMMMILFQKGDLTKAEPYLTKVLEDGGDDDLAEDVYEAMTIGYVADHRLRDAKLCMNLWIEWRPDSLRARLLRAYFHNVVVPNPDLMLAELREVLRIAPRRVAERLAMADLFLHQSKIDEALAECETCRSQAPNDPSVELEFGLCRFRQGQMETAKLALESAVKAMRAGGTGLDDDRLARGCTTLGQIASAERDFEGAARYYEEAVKLSPQDPAANYALGVALKALGNDDGAKQHLERSKILRIQAERLQEITLGLGNDPANIALRVEGAAILREQGLKAEAL
ncbi:MAG TPA: tetratricopeptide repeat protein, partial [Pirellulales bacterium]|nr:tetratricopeptide repeat protein [Pirellulales bacterium]